MQISRPKKGKRPRGCGSSRPSMRGRQGAVGVGRQPVSTGRWGLNLFSRESSCSPNRLLLMTGSLTLWHGTKAASMPNREIFREMKPSQDRSPMRISRESQNLHGFRYLKILRKVISQTFVSQFLRSEIVRLTTSAVPQVARMTRISNHRLLSTGRRQSPFSP
jgi:hypothetical protein